mmetsp:Transcript_33996/g.38747  ORF Transcript_33996/g.38747 Transcript_33996/m.38747 type:complete len:97 (+) Transcript_33996:2510-2800(+)
MQERTLGNSAPGLQNTNHSTDTAAGGPNPIIIFDRNIIPYILIQEERVDQSYGKLPEQQASFYLLFVVVRTFLSSLTDIDVKLYIRIRVVLNMEKS